MPPIEDCSVESHLGWPHRGPLSTDLLTPWSFPEQAQASLGPKRFERNTQQWRQEMRQLWTMITAVTTVILGGFIKLVFFP
jgi:hypothetical protein